MAGGELGGAAFWLAVEICVPRGSGRDGWFCLVAAGDLAYLAAPAQSGLHENGRRTWGHSMLVDPWGRVLAQRDEGAGVVLADFDLVRLETARRQLPALEHRVL